MASNLVAIAQVAELLGVSRTRADELSRRAGFPRPVISGPPVRLWSRRDVVTWDHRRRYVATTPKG